MDAPRILAENEDFVVLHKPAGLLVHPTRPDGAFTLLGWLKELRPDAFWGLVNRLDRETSGLVIAAKSVEIAGDFGRLMMRRSINKEYWAIVVGKVQVTDGCIDGPIGRIGINPENPIWVKRAVKEDGQSAVTHFKTVKQSEARSLLRVIPETGRLHQIRVHLSHIGHPVLGDKLYAGPPELYLTMISHGWTELHDRLLGVKRQALHAARLEFEWKGELLTFESPMPADMEEWCGGMI